MRFNGHEENSETGVDHLNVPVITVTLDPRTLQVTFKCDNLAISVAQMMIDETARQLDIQRRQAAALELQKAIAEAKRTADIVGGLQLKR